MYWNEAINAVTFCILLYILHRVHLLCFIETTIIIIIKISNEVFEKDAFLKNQKLFATLIFDKTRILKKGGAVRSYTFVVSKLNIIMCYVGNCTVFKLFGAFLILMLWPPHCTHIRLFTQRIPKNIYLCSNFVWVHYFFLFNP